MRLHHSEVFLRQNTFYKSDYDLVYLFLDTPWTLDIALKFGYVILENVCLNVAS